jgi:hypothetical protein
MGRDIVLLRHRHGVAVAAVPHQADKKAGRVQDPPAWLARWPKVLLPRIAGMRLPGRLTLHQTLLPVMHSCGCPRRCCPVSALSLLV